MYLWLNKIREKIDNTSTQFWERLNNIKSKTKTKIQAKLCKESNTTLHTEIWYKPWTTSWIGGGSNKPTYCKWNKPNYKTIYRNPEINLVNKCTGNETKQTTELHQQSGDTYHKQTQKATQTTQTPHRQSRDESRKRMYCKSNKTNQRATSTIENWLYSATTCKIVKTFANHVPWRVACGMCVRGRFDAQLGFPLPVFQPSLVPSSQTLLEDLWVLASQRLRRDWETLCRTKLACSLCNANLS